MSRFKVDWTDDARQGLAEAWLAASDRDAVTRASHKIEALLLEGADSCGKLRSEELYELVVHPLSVLYSFSLEDRKVEVGGVRYAPPPSSRS